MGNIIKNGTGTVLATDFDLRVPARSAGKNIGVKNMKKLVKIESPWGDGGSLVEYAIASAKASALEDWLDPVED